MPKKAEPQEEEAVPVEPKPVIKDADVKGIDALANFRIALDGAIADLQDCISKPEYKQITVRSEEAVQFAIMFAQTARMWAGVALKPFPTGFKETDKKDKPESKSKPM